MQAINMHVYLLYETMVYSPSPPEKVKKLFVILLLLVSTALFAVSDNAALNTTLLPIPADAQQPGDAAKGYEYLTTGDFLKSGAPYRFFLMANGKNTANRLNRTGKNATVSHAYNVIEKDGVHMVIPTCLQCHAQVFEGQLVIGLGNTMLDFSNAGSIDFSAQMRMLKIAAPRQYAAAKPFLKSFATVFPKIETEVRGVNAADKLAITLVSHRDAQTLKWSDTPLLPIPEEVIPTDVPAWWMMKKKNAMFYNGFARGDFGKYLMLSNLLTVTDSAEAREVSSHFGDVLAYIRSIEPPKYPKEIDAQKAETGRVVFNNNCSGCHGTYGADGKYPNLLVPLSIIQTDSALCQGVQNSAPFIEWFKRSWFAQGANAPYIVPFNGYLAPPLDGVWITAPYLHNGSVPTLEALLNSKLRPAYWSRTWSYDYKSIGVTYMKHDTAIRKQTYNTTLRGYSNAGHYFGDALTDDERSAVIEYLKTL